jgi:pilus assembly protein CpaB
MTQPAPLATPGGLRRAAERAPRRSGLRAAIFLAFALVAAVATALVLTRYLEARTAAARVPTVKVVVAALDVPLATALRSEALKVVDWPAASRPERAASDPAPLVGRVAITPILKGEPILEAKLASSEAGNGLAALLPEGMRAVAVRVDDVVGVAGFLHPSDNVDVIVTMKPRDDGESPTVSKIILQNIRVLAVGKEVTHAERNVEKTIAATVATLMVDSEQSERLALASTKGKILLSLRSRLDLADVESDGITPPVLLAGAPVVTRVAAEAKPPPPARAASRSRRSAQPRVVTVPPAAEANQVVEVIRGDLFEKRDFQKEAHR